VSGVPQSPQNFSAGSFVKPQAGQATGNGAPHSAQKRRRPDSHTDTGGPHQAYPSSQKCFRLKLYPYAYAIGAVHVEHIDGRPAHGRETDDALGLDPEVLVPAIGTGVEKACQLAGCRIHTREIRPFVTITEMTGEGEVRLVVIPVMLLRHDVLDVKCDDIMLLMDTTILAAVSRTVAHA
jgi:hypothetical protein